MEASSRQTGGVTTRLILSYVRARGGEGAVSDVLRLAGEERPATELEDERTWSTYDQKIALFEAAAGVLGDPQIARHVGESVLEQRVGTSLKILLRALGSPGQVLRNIARTAPKFSTVCTMEAPEVGSSHAVVTYRLHEGFTPHRMDCDYNIGLMSQVSVLFGLPAASITHAECQVRGARQCVYRVRWSDRSRLPWRERRREMAYLKDQLDTLTERTEALQSTIADLVSPDEVDEVLSRIAARAGDAVRAEAYLLAVPATDETGESLHYDGLSEEEARVLAAGLIEGSVDGAAGSRLVADVASARRFYGRIAALYPEEGAFFPEEQRLLAAYARQAAVALDAATALAEAQRRGKTATVLLELARSLAEPATRDEVAERLVRAVPNVVGTDRATVALWDPVSDTLSVRALYGYPEEMEETLRKFAVSPSDTPELQRMLTTLRARNYDLSTTEDRWVRAALENFQSGGVFVVPIARRGEFLGIITVSNDPDRPAPRVTPTLESRMLGLADQAAAALANARLLEQEREHAQRLHEQVYHDALTGLPNRLLFKDRLTHALAHAHRNKESLAVLFLDLDRFKNINDTQGHDIGDLILHRVAERLQGCVRENDTVARMAGDEFTLLLPQLRQPEAAARVARKVLDGFRKPFLLGGREFFLTASIGIALYPADGQHADTLLRNADIAMYRAKDQGRNNYQLYKRSMSARAEEQFALESSLHRALERQELTLHYQPQVDLYTDRIVGAEALVRWRHPDRGLVPAADFIPLAEESGLILPLDDWVLHTACAQARAWRETDLPPIRVAVNLSTRLFQYERLVEVVKGALEASGLDPRLLELEMPESIAAHNIDPIVPRLRELTAIGVKFAMDDFGAGYSFLSYLKRFPIDRLKLDESLLREIIVSSDDATIVDAVIAMAHSLKLTVIAEGVETREQLAFLHEHRCDQVQGQLFGLPVPAEEFESLLRRGSGRWEYPAAMERVVP